MPSAKLSTTSALGFLWQAKPRSRKVQVMKKQATPNRVETVPEVGQKPLKREEPDQNDAAPEYTPCRQCGKWIHYSGHPGPQAEYCSRPCRQAAYRQRQGATPRVRSRTPPRTTAQHVTQIPDLITALVTFAARQTPPYETGNEESHVKLRYTRGHRILELTTPLQLAPWQVTLLCKCKGPSYTSYRDNPSGSRTIFVAWKEDVSSSDRPAEGKRESVCVP
jgi:hypothetical protein